MKDLVSLYKELDYYTALLSSANNSNQEEFAQNNIERVQKEIKDLKANA